MHFIIPMRTACNLSTLANIANYKDIKAVLLDYEYFHDKSNYLDTYILLRLAYVFMPSGATGIQKKTK